MEDDHRRMGAHYFSSDRQVSFRKKARKEVLKQNMQKHDEERRRMEEYRRLCKREGIVSSRLQEYDERRTQARNTIDERLRTIDEDDSLRNTEKKRAKYAVKQSLARQSLASLQGKKANPVEKAMQASENKKELLEQEKKDTEDRKKNARKQRSQNNQLLKQRTRHGQPLMSGKVQFLLNKITKK